MTPSIKHLGFLGCGNMGEAILAGICQKNILPRKSIYVLEANLRRARQLKKRFRIQLVKSSEELFSVSDCVLLAVKPQSLAALSPASQHARTRVQCVISILAGTAAASVRQALHVRSVIRVMPNLGALKGKAMTVIAKPSSEAKPFLAFTEMVFSSCGKTLVLPESKMHLVTALSGSGPAYFFYLAELLMQNGLKRGLSREQSYLLAKQTIIGAASLLEGNLKPDELRQRVTSKGGTTEAALTVLIKNKFSRVFSEAISAAILRGKALGS